MMHSKLSARSRHLLAAAMFACAISFAFFSTAFAQAPSSFERLDCSLAEGWACLPSGSTVEFYDGDRTSGVLLGSSNLTVDRSDIIGGGVCPSGISNPVGFRYDVPSSLLDGAPHDVHAYGVNADTGDVHLLQHAPRSITCTSGDSDLDLSDASAIPLGDGDYEIRAEIENIGSGPTPSDFPVRFELDYDDDGTVDVTDTFTVGSLGVGERYPFSVVVPFTQFGSHSFILTANPGLAAFSEPNLGNNSHASYVVDYSDSTVALDPTEPPEIVLFGVREEGSGDAWEHHSIRAHPGDELEIAWAAENASSCTSLDPGIFTTGGETSGIAEIDEMGPGTTREIDIECTGPGGVRTATEHFSVLQPDAPELEVGLRVYGSGKPFRKELVAVLGDQIEMKWDSSLDASHPDWTSMGAVADVSDSKRDDPEWRWGDYFMSDTLERMLGDPAPRMLHPNNGTMVLADGASILHPPRVNGSSLFAHVTTVRWLTNIYERKTAVSSHYYVLPPDAPAPTVTLRHKTSDESQWSASDGRNIEAGEDIEFRWVSENAQECTSPDFTTNAAWRGVATEVTEPAVGTSDTYTITCTGPGGTGSDSVTITTVDTTDPVPPGPTGGGSSLPDLEPTSVRATEDTFWTKDAANREWDDVELQLVFGNYGDASLSGPVSYRFDIDYGNDGTFEVTDLTSDWTGTLDVDETTSILTAEVDGVVPGTHLVRVRIDEDPDRISESNENDNVTERTIDVDPPEPILSLTPDRDVVREGQTAELDFDVPVNYALDCELNGGGLTYTFSTPSETSGTQTTDPLANTTEFTLTCNDPAYTETYETTATVEVVPALEEI